MNKMDELRRNYDSTEIPPELSQIVNNALCQAENGIPKENDEECNHKGVMKMSDMKNQNAENNVKSRSSKGRSKLMRNVTVAAAAFAVVFGSFGYGVATNEAFADSVSNVPILSTLARVFIGEQIKEADNTVKIDMTLPKVEGLTDKKVEDQINKEIHDKMTAVVEESKERIAEEKKAWLDTGGTEEDYMVREIFVDYEVKAVNDDTLSFVVSKLETAASAYYDLLYYNIDLKTNEEIMLSDLLGDDYIKTANEQVAAQIAERSKNPDNIYFDGTDGVDGFKTIAANQNFYVNEAGNPVVVFNKYEIAPGYMGIQEFEITK